MHCPSLPNLSQESAVTPWLDYRQEMRAGDTTRQGQRSLAAYMTDCNGGKWQIVRQESPKPWENNTLQRDLCNRLNGTIAGPTGHGICVSINFSK